MNLIMTWQCPPEPLYPSCRQTTCASRVPQKSSAIVPQTPLLHTSTRPSDGERPLTRRTPPSVQFPGWKHLTPASSKWESKNVFLENWQFCSLDSVPMHCTLSKWIGPCPWPKEALGNIREAERRERNGGGGRGKEEGGREGERKIQNTSHTPNTLYHTSLLPLGRKPSCLQTTIPSLVSHRSSVTVPHTPEIHTSTRPSAGDLPPTNWIDQSGLHSADYAIGKKVIFYVTPKK